MIAIQKASQKDTEQLTALARSIYREHYLHLWHPGGADWYMHEYAYAADKLEKELSDPNVAYYLAEEDGIPVAYLKLVLNSIFKGHEEKSALEVERIYIRRSATGKGIGKQLMQFSLEKARELKKEIIFLKAMDSSTGAIAFYQQQGYRLCGTLHLPMPDFQLMKEEFRGMVVMMREVG